jgi:hypothetical protein
MDLLIDVLYYSILFFGVCGTVELVYRLIAGRSQVKPKVLHLESINKIDRIKALRAQTGLSWHECKERIDKEES